jgi:hypothetical protein
MRKAAIRLIGIMVLALSGVFGGIGVAPVAAQVPVAIAASDTVWQIRLADGSTLIGQVVGTEAGRITVRTAGDVTVDLTRTQIQSMTVARGTVRNGVLWPQDPNRTRLFFGPTARMLDQGEGYVSIFELFLPFVAYAITDNVTIAGGTPIIPEAIGRVWYFAPKVGFDLGPRSSVAAGVMAFADTGGLTDDFDSFGIFYGVGTYGTEDHAGTVAVGWGFAGADVENRPAFSFGGETRVSPRLKLLSENYLVTYREYTGARDETRAAGLISGGVRFFGERLSADAGLGLTYGGGGSFCCIPLVNFVYNFGGPR